MTLRAEPDQIERRPGRGADELPGHIVHPNNSLVDSTCARFLAAAGRAVFAMLEEAS